MIIGTQTLSITQTFYKNLQLELLSLENITIVPLTLILDDVTLVDCVIHLLF